ncbi:MAG: hypothetical protein HOP19_16545 [Acidobacteria bacterium]|nr:hypothetical protein [Acidobacteriota bacterium]
MTPAPPAPPTPTTPLDPVVTIAQSIEARDQLSLSLPALQAQHEAARQEFLRTLAGDLQKTVSDAVRERWLAWQSTEARAVEQLEARQQLLNLFTQRVETFKQTSLDETTRALQSVITRLTNERGQVGADQSALNARLAKLTDELKPLQIVLPSPAPPRDPKDKPGPPTRTINDKNLRLSAGKKRGA